MPDPKSEVDPYRDLFGVDFTDERLHANLQAFRDICSELVKLRQLDLTEVHPAVIFEPTAVYRRKA